MIASAATVTTQEKRIINAHCQILIHLPEIDVEDNKNELGHVEHKEGDPTMAKMCVMSHSSRRTMVKPLLKLMA